MIFLCQFVARRADLIGMRARKNWRRIIVGTVVLELVEPDVGALLQDLGENAVGGTIDKEHTLGAIGHMRNPLFSLWRSVLSGVACRPGERQEHNCAREG